MESVLPLLIIRSDVHSLIEVNGRMEGEVLPDGHLALPLSDTGDYYICAIPLKDETSARRYCVTRKLSVQDGVVEPPHSDDVELCTWPGSAYELFLRPGTLPREAHRAPPFTLSELTWRQGQTERRFTLYYENGLRLCVQEAGAILCAYTLGEGDTGALSFTEVDGTKLLAASVQAGARQRLLIVDYDFAVLLDITADAVLLEDGRPCAIHRKDTLLGHEQRILYALGKDGFAPLDAQVGFFTHAYRPPQDRLSAAIAFCEAVREGLEEEARSYLAQDLAKALDFNDIREFFGDFDCCRPPLSDRSGRLLGLIYHSGAHLKSAQLFEFEYEGAMISNVTEY